MTKVIWSGRQVTIHEGRADGNHDFGEEFPFLATEGDGLEVVVPSWALGDDGEYELMCAGVNFDDLITELIGMEVNDTRDENIDIRARAIKTLRDAIHRLENETISTCEIGVIPEKMK